MANNDLLVHRKLADIREDDIDEIKNGGSETIKVLNSQVHFSPRIDTKSTSLSSSPHTGAHSPADSSSSRQRRTKNADENEQDKINPEIDPLLLNEADMLDMPKNCAEQVEQFAKYVWESGWRVMPHHALPNWLRDNDFLLKGHRPPLPSVKECFKSIFRVHTETGNIWTHLVGAVAFIAIAVYFLTRPDVEVQAQEKLVFGTFFSGAIICLVCSTLFHIFYCHSPKVSKLFNK